MCRVAIPPGTWECSSPALREAPSYAAGLVTTIRRTLITGITTRTRPPTATTLIIPTPEPTATEARPTGRMAARTGEPRTIRILERTLAELQHPRHMARRPLLGPTTLIPGPMERPIRAQTPTDRGDHQLSARMAIRRTRSMRRTPMASWEQFRHRRAVRVRPPALRTAIPL